MKFRVKQYQTFVVTYEVEAENQAEAIKHVLDGNADEVQGSEEYVEVAEDRGNVIDEKGDFIPSICDVEELKG